MESLSEKLTIPLLHSEIFPSLDTMDFKGFQGLDMIRMTMKGSTWIISQHFFRLNHDTVNLDPIHSIIEIYERLECKLESKLEAKID